jgi:hypothetical protein
MNFYGPVYDAHGNPLFTRDGATGILFWDDACWHRCMPEDCRDLTYLDVGFHQGSFLLRFWQRGGKATGLDLHPDGYIQSSTKDYRIGGSFFSHKAEAFRKMHGADYDMRIGGFDSNSRVVPGDIGKFNIVSSINVIEYMDDPLACVRSLFDHATDMVLIATDTAPETCSPGPPPLKFATSVQDLVDACKWPCVAWTYDGGDMDAPQVFVCSVNPEGKLKLPSAAEIQIDPRLAITATEAFYRSSKR